jgi:DNA polymerase-3 subunit chi
MTEANIYTLTKTPWQKAFPKLLEQIVANKNRVHVICDNDNFMADLDELIWTFEQLSFIPHATMKDHNFKQSPILLSTEEENSNQATILAVTGKKIPGNVKSYEKLIYMYHEEDKLAHETVKNFIGELQKQSIVCNFFKQNGSGSWERSRAR